MAKSDSWVKGRTALVTGAAGGIGTAIVKALQAEGLTVTGADLTDSCADYSITGDLTDAGFCDSLPSHAAELMGGLMWLSTTLASSRAAKSRKPRMKITAALWRSM